MRGNVDYRKYADEMHEKCEYPEKMANYMSIVHILLIFQDNLTL